MNSLAHRSCSSAPAIPRAGTSRIDIDFSLVPFPFKFSVNQSFCK